MLRPLENGVLGLELIHHAYEPQPGSRIVAVVPGIPGFDKHEYRRRLHRHKSRSQNGRSAFYAARFVHNRDALTNYLFGWPLYYDEAWLRTELAKRKGDFNGLCEDYGFDPKVVRNYARTVFKWDPTGASNAQRDQLYDLYFAEVDKVKRPSVRSVAQELGIATPTAHRWVREARRGQLRSLPRGPPGRKRTARLKGTLPRNPVRKVRVFCLKEVVMVDVQSIRYPHTLELSAGTVLRQDRDDDTLVFLLESGVLVGRVPGPLQVSSACALYGPGDFLVGQGASEETLTALCDCWLYSVEHTFLAKPPYAARYQANLEAQLRRARADTRRRGYPVAARVVDVLLELDSLLGGARLVDLEPLGQTDMAHLAHTSRASVSKVVTSLRCGNAPPTRVRLQPPVRRVSFCRRMFNYLLNLKKFWYVSASITF